MSERPPPSTLAERIARARIKILKKGEKKLVKKLRSRAVLSTPTIQSSSQPLHEVIPDPISSTPVGSVDIVSPGAVETETLVAELDKIMSDEQRDKIDRGNSCEEKQENKEDELREDVQGIVDGVSRGELNVAEGIEEQFMEQDNVETLRKDAVESSKDVSGTGECIEGSVSKGPEGDGPATAEVPGGEGQEPVTCLNPTGADDADFSWTESDEDGNKEVVVEKQESDKEEKKLKRKRKFGAEDEKVTGEEEEDEVVFVKENKVEPEKRRRLVRDGKPVLKSRLVDEDSEGGDQEASEPVVRRVGTRSAFKMQMERIEKLGKTVKNVKMREEEKKKEEEEKRAGEEEEESEAGSYVEPSDSDTDSEVESKKKRKEVDREAFFSRHQVLPGSILYDEKEFHMKSLLRMIGDQGWLSLFGNNDRKLFVDEVREFYTNCRVVARRVFTTVKEVEIEFGRPELGVILDVPAEGYCRYVKLKWPKRTDRVTPLDVVRKFSGKPRLRKERKVEKKEMEPAHQLLFEFVHRFLLPRGERNCEASALDLTYMDLMDRGVKINLPGLIIRHIKRICDTDQKPHSLVHSYIIHQILEHFGVPLGAGKKPTIHQRFGVNVLKSCDFFQESRASKRPMQVKQEQSEDSEEYGPDEAIGAVQELEKMVLEVNEENAELHRQLKVKDQEIDRLKIDCHKYEAELVMERAKNTKQLEALVKHFNLQL